jgi:amino acid adenylation domain-containing protein
MELTLPRTTLVDGLLDAAVAAHPHAPAVRDATGRWTYAELDAASWACARWLREQGIGPSDRVVAQLGNRREFLALMFGTLRAQAVFVPLNPEMKPFHLRGVLADARPHLVVVDDARVPMVRALTTAQVHPPSALPLSGPRPGDTGTAGDPALLALLIYTSGSTALPKAVASPHAPVLFATRAIARRLAYRADDVVLVAVPLSFDYGLYQVFLSVLAGAELVLGEPDAHVRLMATIRQCGVTVVPLVPSLGELLTRLAGRDRAGATRVRMLTNTGAALTAPLAAGLRRVFPGAVLVPMFGTTECKRISVAEPDGDLRRPGSVGRPLDGTEVLIVADGRAVPPGQVGEIVVRGPHVMSGYWRAPEATVRRFRPDPETGGTLLYTGDFGYLDADGYLYFTGRRDDLFKRSGLRVSAVEIEAAAADVEGVSAAAVLPPAGTRDVVLFVVADLSPGAVLEQLARRLERGKVPACCHVLPALPLTPNGKADKRRLAALVEEEERDATVVG